jgi:SurA N-terminal domain
MNSKKLARGALVVVMTLLGMALAQADVPAFFVNDQPVSETELARARRSDQLSTLGLKGAIGLDVQLMLLNQVILIKAAQQDSANVLVTSAEVDEAIAQIRAQNNLSDDASYLAAIEGQGFTDESFRTSQKEQLQIQKRVEEITASAKPSDAESKLYYELHPDQYGDQGKPNELFENLRPDLRKKLQTDVNKIKQNEVIEAWVEDIITNADVRFPEASKLELFDPAVASVDGFEIRLNSLLREVYSNPQIVEFVRESPSNELTQTFFKPQALENLINRGIARQYASRSRQAFFGSHSELFEQIGLEQVRNVQVSEAEIRAYFLVHKSAFIAPAIVSFWTANFANLKDATKFRTQLLKAKGQNFVRLAAKNHGTANEYEEGDTDQRIGSQSISLDPKQLTRVDTGHISQIVRKDGWFEVYLITKIKPASLKTFKSVRADVAVKTLAQARDKAATAWWTAERKNHVIVNNLPAVQAELEARAKRMGL